MKRLKAFTLIEVMAVLLLTATLSGIAVVWLAGSRNPLKLADAAAVMGEVIQFDALTRAQAQQFDASLLMRFDLNTAMLSRIDPSTGTLTGGSLTLPPGWRIQSLAVADDEVTSGAATLVCSPAGWTPTYSLSLLDPQQTHHGLVVAGMTGQTLALENEDETHHVLALLSSHDTR